MKSSCLSTFTLITFLFFSYNVSGQQLSKARHLSIEPKLISALENFTNHSSFISQTGYNKNDSTHIDSIIIDFQNKNLKIYFDTRFAYTPIRENTLEILTHKVRQTINHNFDNFNVSFFSDGQNLEAFIPNYYRSNSNSKDKSRIIKNSKRTTNPLVINNSKPFKTSLILHNTNIAIWPSHGWYYERSLNRWEWQRARFFNTVEDLYTTSYTMNYLVPMLENAGANIFLPRERHWQTNEVIVDNDSCNLQTLFNADVKVIKTDTGFAIGNTPYINENPFKLGTALRFESHKRANKSVEYLPNIPETGTYPVYISFVAKPENTNEAIYKVYHTGGITQFKVNQQIGGGTWIYLGNFVFQKGIHRKTGRVELLNYAKNKGETVSADAVRFGGGMGNISRNGQTSGRPRYQEAARYYLQYAGVPDTLVWWLNDTNDYADDYQCRGEWVNYLMGAPSGPKKDRNAKGLGIPIDISLGFHTDAGIKGGDTIVGTLGIYSTKVDTSIFPNGLSKMASRDMADLIQSQIVEDIRTKYNKDWTRRGLWNKAYSEASRPNVPAMLLELYSHQNFMDVRFGKEPSFQFDVSRAVYKGIVKFLATLYGFDYVIQPLPVTHLQTEITPKGNIHLQWIPQPDLLEPTAMAEKYLVYTKMDSGGFDNGTLVENTEFTLKKPEPEVIYSFKVSALNKGGESFPSEELSVCLVNRSKGTVAIINAFDRLGGPAWFNDSTRAGFLDDLDAGVPYMFDFHTTGAQYDFDKNSPWLDDDSPGFGASFADMEHKIIPGNTFNYSYIHGEAIKKAGYSFVSVSDEAVESGAYNLNNYKTIDFLAGEEKTTYMPKNDSVKHYQIFTAEMIQALKNYVNKGGNIFLSGAYIATDIKANAQDSVMASILNYKWRTNHASRLGNCYFTINTLNYPQNQYYFNTEYNSKIYTVESPDALEPANEKAKTFIRYTENNMSAGILFNDNCKIAAMGFPFETITNPNQREEFMKIILDFLNK